MQEDDLKNHEPDNALQWVLDKQIRNNEKLYETQTYHLMFFNFFSFWPQK